MEGRQEEAQTECAGGNTHHEGDALRADHDGEHRAVARAERVDHADGALDEVEKVAEAGHAAGDEGRREGWLSEYRRRRRQQRVEERAGGEGGRGGGESLHVVRVGEGGEGQTDERQDGSESETAAAADGEQRSVEACVRSK